MAPPDLPYVGVKATRLVCATHALHYEVLSEFSYKYSYSLVSFYPPRRYQSVQVQPSTIQMFSLASITPRLIASIALPKNFT